MLLAVFCRVLSASCAQAASVATSLGRALARLDLRALITSPQPELAHWLQPQHLVELSAEAEPKVTRNAAPGRSPAVRVRMRAADLVPHADLPSESEPEPEPEQAEPRRYRGLPLLSSRCHSAEAAVPFANDYSQEKRPEGSYVLRTVVSTDGATQQCDAVFDRAFDGVVYYRVPDFPPDLTLPGSIGTREPEPEPEPEPTAAGAESVGANVQIGMIVGPSGCAKSVLLRLHFGWPADLPNEVWSASGGGTLISHFLGQQQADRGAEDTVAEAFSAVGLCLHRDGSRRYAHLSQGEQHLADIAYLLVHSQRDSCGKAAAAAWRGSGTLLLDEFTSCLDRRTARKVARSISLYCRAHAEQLPRVVIAGCHADVIGRGAMVPDWVFEADTMTLCSIDATEPQIEDEKDGCSNGKASGEMLLHAPSIELRLRACAASEWRYYRDHHYKTQTLSSAARTFALTLDSLRYGDEPTGNYRELLAGVCTVGCAVGFVATIPQAGGGVSDAAPSASAHKSSATISSPRKGGWRAHRTVVLPAWQGLGVGSRLSDAAAELHHSEGYDYFGQTVHPRFGAYRDASPLWRPTLWNHSTQRYKIESWKQRTSNTRVRLRTPRYVYSHYYMGAEDGGAEARAALVARVVLEE